MNQMGERKVGSLKCSQGTTKALKVWRPTARNIEVCWLKIGQVSIKGIGRRITIGNDLFWSQFAKCYE